MATLIPEIALENKVENKQHFRLYCHEKGRKMRCVELETTQSHLLTIVGAPSTVSKMMWEDAGIKSEGAILACIDGGKV